jgi:hypothetical protein
VLPYNFFNVYIVQEPSREAFMETFERILFWLVVLTMVFAIIADGGAMFHLWPSLGDFAPGFPIAYTPFGVSILIVVIDIKIFRPILGFPAGH